MLTSASHVFLPRLSNSAGKLLSKVANLASVARAADGDYKDGEVVCDLNNGADPKDVAARNGMKVKEDLKNGTYSFKLAKSQTVMQAVTQLSGDPGVGTARPNYIAGLVAVTQRGVAFVDQRSVAFVNQSSSATNYYFQDALRQISARDAWQKGDGSGVTVAVIDTGIDPTHPIFTHLTKGYDFIDDDTNVSEVPGGPAYGHGTMMAGIVAAVAPGATIMPLRAFDSTGYASVTDIAAAILYAVNHGANVINMSYGLDREDKTIKPAIEYADRKGVYMVAASGNSNRDYAEYPASNDKVISVAAVDGRDVKADFSNYNHVRLCAPGVNISSAYPGGLYATGSGTSHAAAFVSGGVAVVLSAGSGDPADSLRHNADSVKSQNPHYNLGDGRIDLLAAVQERRH